MLVVIFQTTDFAVVTPSTQLMILALVTMIHIPCLALILSLVQVFGWRKAAVLAAFEVIFAIIVGGISFRVLNPIM
jgi:ferrous iron transport protein B